MSKTPTWLLDHARNVYSQCGEDGIIEKILEIIPQKNQWCVEFGAWDGLYLTNTRYLIESKNYSAVLIEGDKCKASRLNKNYAKNNNVTTINKFVGCEPGDSLDHILGKSSIPQDFDFLSIDIDGNDYHVWKAFSKYKPKVVVIEYNPTIPTEINFVQPLDPSVSQGSSLLALVELGKQKGYELVAVNIVNLFFVKKEYYLLFELDTNAPGILRTDLSAITYLFVGYDGKVFLRGCKKLYWHNIEFKESKIQQLPRFLRKFPGNYSRLRKIMFVLYFFWSSPLKAMNIVIKKTLFKN
jgi:hypothetical protein